MHRDLSYWKRQWGVQPQLRIIPVVIRRLCEHWASITKDY